MPTGGGGGSTHQIYPGPFFFLLLFIVGRPKALALELGVLLYMVQAIYPGELWCLFVFVASAGVS